MLILTDIESEHNIWIKAFTLRLFSIYHSNEANLKMRLFQIANFQLQIPYYPINLSPYHPQKPTETDLQILPRLHLL
jgi:hypothetical protein